MKKTVFNLVNTTGGDSHAIYVKPGKTGKVSSKIYYEDDRTVGEYVSVPFAVECWHLSKEWFSGWEVSTLDHYQNGKVVDSVTIKAFQFDDWDEYQGTVDEYMAILQNLIAV